MNFVLYFIWNHRERQIFYGFTQIKERMESFKLKIWVYFLVLFCIIPLCVSREIWAIGMDMASFMAMHGRGGVPKLMPQIGEPDYNKVEGVGWSQGLKDFLNRLNTQSFRFDDAVQSYFATYGWEAELNDPNATDQQKINAIHGLVNNLNFLSEDETKWTSNILIEALHNQRLSMEVRAEAAGGLGVVAANLGAGQRGGEDNLNNILREIESALSKYVNYTNDLLRKAALEALNRIRNYEDLLEELNKRKP